MSHSSHSSSVDSEMVNAIVQNLKSRGIFDEFRRECLSDADTKPSFQNLLQRVEGYVSKFLSQQKWQKSLNKNQLRERLRTQINESVMLKYGIEHLVEQVVNFKMNSLFLPKIESVVKEFLGIEEIPFIHENESFFKSNHRKNAKIEENNEIKVKNIKTEPKEEKINEELEPMDIETDSNSSNENKAIKDEKDNSLHTDSEKEYIDWPTPPQPETLTPDRNEVKELPIDVHDVKDKIQLIDSTNSVPFIKVEDNEIFDPLTAIKESETFLLSKPVIKEEPKEIESKVENKTKEHDLSDVSSVHTSDLSDFDDEISLDDSNDEREDSKKKKISLKVVKKITAVLSNEQIKDKVDKHDSSVERQGLEQKPNVKRNFRKESNSESKRIRKVNPKYVSDDFSSIFNEKERNRAVISKDETEEESENSNNAISNERLKAFKYCESNSSDQKLMPKKRRPSNSSENDNKEINEISYHKSAKLSKRSEDLSFETRSSSRASAESSLSETTQDSTTSQTRTKRKVSKTRNECQTQQRYDASDLYKPRPLISSRRTRGPTTPDINTLSNDDFVIHDLSK